MCRVILALACVVFLLSCSRGVLKDPTDADKLYRTYQEHVTAKDTLSARQIKDKIIQKYPVSKETFDLASSEFYERLYPVWDKDSLKIEMIRDMLVKYPSTQWRRTMYEYLLNSLSKTKRHDDLKRTIDDFINEFEEDYLPYTTSARYCCIDLDDTLAALNFAKQGFELSKNYPRLDHFPKKKWELEKRSAPVRAGTYYAEILIDRKKFDKAFEILKNILDSNTLTVDDETTLAPIYYLLGRAYNGTGNNDLAAKYLSKALIAGDSRNVWQLCDSLYIETKSMDNSAEVLLDIRKDLKYDDIVFEDVTEQYGLSDVRGSRVAWGDYDNDGYQDLLIDGKRLFKNMKGKAFYEITDLAFPEDMAARGGLWGDFNNDGALDIVTMDPEAVWINDKGVFKKISGENSVTDNSIPTEGIGIADLNMDGYLDIYYANYEKKSGEYGRDELYLGSGEGKFESAAAESGVLPAGGKNRAGRGVSIADHNNDGKPDIFVSNYRLTDNFLLINNGKADFRHAAKEKGIAGTNTGGWWGHTIGAEWGDINNDGYLDLINANLAHPRYIDLSDMTKIYLNSGPPDYTFTDIRREAGIKFEETHSEPALGDLNNNGYLDLYLTSVYKNRRSFLYMNKGDTAFEDITYLSGTRIFNGWGVAFADIDNDGKTDIITAGGQIKLFQNITPGTGNWLKVKITGKDHSDGIGTRLKLYNDNISLIREVQGGKGSTNQHSLIQHFGLGTEKDGFTLEIKFFGGDERSVEIEEINRTIKINE